MRCWKRYLNASVTAAISGVLSACGPEPCHPGESRCVDGQHESCVLTRSDTYCDPPSIDGTVHCRAYENGEWIRDGACEPATTRS